MKTPLVPIQITSIYKSRAGQRVPLPSRMALCTPDTAAAIAGIEDEIAALGGELMLSDLLRSYDMQLQAHLDYTSGKKSAFSPAPGGSMHEGGRAFDLDLGALKIKLGQFWDIARKYGVTPIIKSPNPSASEAGTSTAAAATSASTPTSTAGRRRLLRSARRRRTMSSPDVDSRPSAFSQPLKSRAAARAGLRDRGGQAPVGARCGLGRLVPAGAAPRGHAGRPAPSSGTRGARRALREHDLSTLRLKPAAGA